jgi:hypothetical protein
MLVLILSLGRFHLLWRLRRSTLGHACIQNSSWRYSHITSNNLTAFVDLVICGISARSLGHGTASSLPWAWRPISQSTNSLSIAPTFSTMEPVYDSHLWRMASSLKTYGLKCGALCPVLPSVQTIISPTNEMDGSLSSRKSNLRVLVRRIYAGRSVQIGVSSSPACAT